MKLNQQMFNVKLYPIQGLGPWRPILHTGPHYKHMGLKLGSNIKTAEALLQAQWENKMDRACLVFMFYNSFLLGVLIKNKYLVIRH